jgi:flagellar hook-associated protein 3 FlgL
MRVSTGYQFDTYASGISKAQSALFEAQRQVATGKRLNAPSDDPFGTAVSLGMRSIRSAIAQYRGNLQTAKSFISFTENALADSHGVLRRAYEIAVRGASDATDQSGRDTMAIEVEDLQARLLDLANAKSGDGRHLFAGQRTNAKPFAVSGGAITYQGDAGQLKTEIAPNEEVSMNSSMSGPFMEAYQRLETLKNHLRGGNAAALSGISVQDLQSSLRVFNGERGAIGVRLQTLSARDAQHERRSDELTKGISDIEEVDMSQAIINYRSADAALQAALSVAAQGFRLSLMDFIRG